MVNKYSGSCKFCGSNVPANGGTLVRDGRRLAPAHLACSASSAPEVTTFRFSSGHTATQNSRGRCEDAPCCGCCTI